MPPALKLTQSQSETLNAIFDTFLGSLTEEEERNLQKTISENPGTNNYSSTQISSLAKINASTLGVQQPVLDVFQRHVEVEKQQDFTKVLDMLGSNPGSLLLTGHWTVFKDLSRQEREQVLLKWKTSSFSQLRQLYRSLTGMCLFTAYSRTHSPINDFIGNDTSPEGDFFANHADYQPVERRRLPMLTFEEITDPSIKFDVIVVGSGAGGGVAAAELSAAGHSVLVIEKGKYYHNSDLVNEEEVGYDNLYDKGTSTSTVDGSISVLSGSNFGGGTSVNYLVSLKPQYFVREDWAKQGLSYFMNPQFDKDLNRVFERIGASTVGHTHGKANQKFAIGCRNLGYPHEDVPVNSGGRPHFCPKCIIGCKSGIKNGTTNTWHQDAWDNGAKFLDQTRVIRVLSKDGKASGVECVVHGKKKIVLNAKLVVVSAGSLHTPGTLQNSGLKNPNIGKHLRLHPLSICFGFYDEEIYQTRGSLIDSVCNASDDCHGDKYGAKIEESLLLPGSYASQIPWLGAAKHKELMLRRNNAVSLLNIVRDRDSGSVCYDAKQNLSINYSLSKHDEKSLVTCIERNMKIFAASGARELYINVAGIPPFAFRKDEESRADNPRFLKWLTSFHKQGILSVSSPLVSVHQLGSCRMGTSPKTSAVKPTGETWEIKNLYVADGSVFPTACGVNPMATIEAISLHVSRNAIASLSSSRL
ncbi:long-chain fatty alcohol dehydrogenase [Backusella circina FSU 941]|nr:long-chain fatty alcohol dehydrogenase [Backusella circina FSU 941]